MDHSFLDLFLVLGTWALVVATLWLGWHHATIFRKQMESLRSDFRSDLKVRLQLVFTDRFDSDRMKDHRSRLAERLLAADVAHDTVQEDVMNFFEDMALLLDHGYLDEDLLWNTFGFYAVRWGAACNDYILEERKRTSDPTVFDGFKDLVERFIKRDREEGLPEPTKTDINAFLQDERNLLPL